MNLLETMKQALELISTMPYSHHAKSISAIANLRAAIEQYEAAKPVAWRYKPREGGWSWNLVEWMPVDEVNYVTEPLYTLEELK